MRFSRPSRLLSVSPLVPASCRGKIFERLRAILHWPWSLLPELVGLVLALKLLWRHLELAKVGSELHCSVLHAVLDLHVLVLCDHFPCLLHVDVHFRFDLSLLFCPWCELFDSSTSILPTAKLRLFALVILARWNGARHLSSERGNLGNIRAVCR